MKKNGFTLVELLAVIVILAILMVVIGVSLSEPKKQAHIKELQKLENSIESIGADFYIDNRDKFSNLGKYKVPLTLLKEYLKNIRCEENEEGVEACSLIKPSNNNETCEAYLLIDTENSDDMFGAYVDCGEELYITESINIDGYITVN